MLEEKAMWLPIDSIRTTTPALATVPQAAHLRMMSVLFLSVMRHDPANPRDRRNDSLCFSKGHPAPIPLGPRPLRDEALWESGAPRTNPRTLTS